MERVIENIYVTTDIKGCNPGYVVTSEGIVAIDALQLPPKAVEMREEILKKGPIRYLVNTENHFDHIFGNHFFDGLCPGINLQLMSDEFWVTRFGEHPDDRTLASVETDDPEGMALIPGKGYYIVNTPSITFHDRLSLRLGSHQFELHDSPGHAKGRLIE